MKENNSSVKGNQSRNFSSVATVANSNSPKSSPKRDAHISLKEKIKSDPKFSNEFLFEKQFKKLNSNLSLNIKPNNGSIYLTGIGNVNDIKSELYQNIDTKTIEYPNLSRSISKKDSITNINHKLNLGLPYIKSYHYKENEISPIFSCCDQQLNPTVLNKVVYQQKEKENESKYRLCKTVENAKKLIVKPFKAGSIVIPDGPKGYVLKTKELNRIRYCMNLRSESMKKYNNSIRDQIKSIDYTIKSINAYRNNLENRFLSEYNQQLRVLDKAILNDKLEDEKLKNEIVKLKKINTNLLAKIKKNEFNKYYIEKWIGMQIYVKEGILLDEKNISDYISEKYNGKLIIDSPEEFDEMFQKKEKKNLKLIEKLNMSQEEKIGLFKDLKILKENNIDDKELTLSILEKEKLLNLLKMRNNQLLIEKRELSKGQHLEISNNLSASTPNILPKKNFMDNKNREKKTDNKINLNNIYKLIQKGFNYIVENDKETTGNFKEALHNINTILNRSTKALTQMKIIEMSYTFLTYYKENNIQRHQKFYEKIMEQIDLEKKMLKSEKYKKEEKERALELYKKFEAKKDKIIFKPRHQDIYSNLIYIEKIKREERRKNKKSKKEIDIYDFLYDIDEEKEEEKKK